MMGAGAHGSHASHGGHGAIAYGRAFGWGIGLNTAFVVAELASGYLAGSVALIADAGHNLSDVLGLVAAWAAWMLSKRRSSDRFTYGLRGSSILAALFNAMLLLVAVFGIAWEAIVRFQSPAPVAGVTVVIVAAAGIAVNGVTAWLLAGGRDHDLNVRGAFLHMVADTAVSAGVVLAGVAIMLTGRAWIDPATSLVIVAVIAVSTWGLLRDSVAMALNAVPRQIDIRAVRSFLSTQPGVARVHHVHIWPTSTTEVALTAHLVMPGGHPGDSFLAETIHELDVRFGIAHATIQVEIGAAAGIEDKGEPPRAQPSRVRHA